MRRRSLLTEGTRGLHMGLALGRHTGDQEKKNGKQKTREGTRDKRTRQRPGLPLSNENVRLWQIALVLAEKPARGYRKVIHKSIFMGRRSQLAPKETICDGVWHVRSLHPNNKGQAQTLGPLWFLTNESNSRHLDLACSA